MPMPLTSSYRLCSRNLAWACLFIISSQSAERYVFVIISTEYSLLLALFKENC